MGIYVNRGRKLRAEDLKSHSAWIAFGRPSYLVGITDNTWPSEPTPTSESVSDDETSIDADVNDADRGEIPFKLVQVVHNLKAQVGGPIIFNAVEYVVDDISADATHILFQLDLEPTDFDGSDDFRKMYAWRRIELWLDPVRPSSKATASSLRRSEFEDSALGASLGKLVFYDNITTVTRATNERHQIQVVLQA